jgi:etoposide-induced 2.4 mRNA
MATVSPPDRSTGLPSATVCIFFPGLAGVALFALVLPYVRHEFSHIETWMAKFMYNKYIIQATSAHPVPKHPYSPVSSSQETDGQVQSPRALLYPSPFIPIRIPVFDMVIAIDNFVVRLLSVGSSSGSRIRTTLKESTLERRQLSGDLDVAANAEEGNFYGIRKTTRKLN